MPPLIPVAVGLAAAPDWETDFETAAEVTVTETVPVAAEERTTLGATFVETKVVKAEPDVAGAAVGLVVAAVAVGLVVATVVAYSVP